MAYGTNWQQWLYDHSPGAGRNLIASCYGLRQRRERYGRDFRESLALLRESQSWSTDRLMQYQTEQTAEFLKASIPFVPYLQRNERYRALLEGADLKSVPVLTKHALRDNRNAFQHKHLPGEGHRSVHTSGTTGQALVFPVSVACFQREYAFRELHYSWGNVSLTARQPFAFCAGHPVAPNTRDTPPFWVRDRCNNHLFFSSYHMSEGNLPAYVAMLDRFQPRMLGGYPSSVYLLSLAYRQHGRGRVRPNAIYTFSETLMPFQREAMESVFQCNVFNWYGNTEMCANIVECIEGRLHLKQEHSLVEILDSEGHDCDPGQSGRLVCTGFGNPLFPLIRYDTGDVATLSTEQSCPCGRPGPIIEQVEGRMEDYVLTPEGRLVGRLDHIFKDSVNVIEAQVVQRRQEEVILRIVRDAAYGGDDEKAILAEARLRLGPSIRIGLDYVPAIPRTVAGKLRFVDSSLDKTEILDRLSTRA